MTSADSSSMFNDPEPIPPRYWWLKRIGLGGLILLTMLVGLRWWWGVVAENRLQAAIAGYRAAGQPVTIEDFQSPPVPDENNAAKLYLEAAKLIGEVPDEHKQLFDALMLDPASVDLADAGKIVDGHANALALVRQARSMSAADWGIVVQSPAITIILPGLSEARNVARVVNRTAHYQHAIGDDAAALETIQDVLAITRTVDAPPFLINHLVSIATANLATQSIEQFAATLNVTDPSTRVSTSATKPAIRRQVRQLITDLLDESAVQQGAVDALHGERMFQFDCMRSLTEGRVAWYVMTTISMGLPSTWERAAMVPVAPLLKLDVLEMMEFTSQHASAMSEPNLPAAKVKFPSPPWYGFRVTRPLSSVLMPSFARTVQLHYAHLQNRRRAAIALATRLYELDHGRLPMKIEDLVPDYLPAVPLDPLSADGSSLDLPISAEPSSEQAGENDRDVAADQSGAEKRQPDGDQP